MRNRWPILLSVIALLILGMWLLPAPKGRRLPAEAFQAALTETQQAIEVDDWDGASAAVADVEDSWRDVRGILVLNNSNADITDTTVAIGRLRGYIDARDRTAALGEAYALQSLWDRLNK